jgi:peptide-methionine (R)-S-oxide reductase
MHRALEGAILRRTRQAGVPTRTPEATMPESKSIDPEELRTRLTPLQFDVTQNAGTERAFSGEYWDNHEAGNYHCVVCGELLFLSDTKFDSGTGWPSFWEAVDPDKVELITDTSHGMVRTEVRCATCGAHLGHLFPDGPQPTGERFCMNSASLDFRK